MKSTTLKFISFTCFLLIGCVQKTHQKTLHFKVDMTFVENPLDVGVRGDFGQNPWKETMPLTDADGDGIYDGQLITKTAQNTMQFKFINHGDRFELSGKDNRVISFEYRPEIIVYEAVFNDPNAKIVDGRNAQEYKRMWSL